MPMSVSHPLPPGSPQGCQPKALATPQLWLSQASHLWAAAWGLTCLRGAGSKQQVWSSRWDEVQVLTVQPLPRSPTPWAQPGEDRRAPPSAGAHGLALPCGGASSLGPRSPLSVASAASRSPATFPWVNTCSWLSLQPAPPGGAVGGERGRSLAEHLWEPREVCDSLAGAPCGVGPRELLWRRGALPTGPGVCLRGPGSSEGPP